MRPQQRRLKAEEAHVPEGVGKPMACEQRLTVRQVQLNQPADLEFKVGGALRQPRQPERPVWRIRSELVELFLEPRLKLVGRDRHTRMAADGELKHVSIIELGPLARYGYRPPSRVAQMGHPGRRWWLWRIAAGTVPGKNRR